MLINISSTFEYIIMYVYIFVFRYLLNCLSTYLTFNATELTICQLCKAGHKVVYIYIYYIILYYIHTYSDSNCLQYFAFSSINSIKNNRNRFRAS